MEWYAEEFWDECVYEHTGDGHPCGASEYATYTAEIVEAEMADLIGRNLRVERIKQP